MSSEKRIPSDAPAPGAPAPSATTHRVSRPAPWTDPFAGFVYGPPRHPPSVRARDIYPAHHLAMGKRPDTQPIPLEDYAQLQRDARVPRRASSTDRAARATLAGALSLPLAGLSTLAAGLLAGGHVAAVVAGIAAALTALRVAVAASDARPL